MIISSCLTGASVLGISGITVAIGVAISAASFATNAHDLERGAPLRAAASKWAAAKSEAQQLFRLVESWADALNIFWLIGRIHAARALPVDTYSWDAPLKLHGSKYWLGLRTSEVYVFEEVYRYKMYDQRADFVAQKGWVVFDIGANIGVVSVLQAQRGARVYALEPNPDCYRRLLRNVTANRLEDRIRPFNLALGGLAGTGTMQVDKGGTTGGTVLAGLEQGASAAQVSISTLDRVVSAVNVDHIDLLKIDVEGAEVDVLRGATRSLEVTQRIILEYHSRQLLSQVEEILRAYGFVRELLIEYCPEDAASNQEEVGITYYSRLAQSVAGPNAPRAQAERG